MKKTIISIIFCSIVIFGITGCAKTNKLGGDEPLTSHEEVILTIETGNKSCIPILLAVYEDGTYELFTTYKACRSGKFCEDVLEYTKSIKGKTDYDVLKIIEDEVEMDKSYSMDNLPEYNIYMGNSYVEKGYGYNYSIEKGQTNKFLEEFLKEIDVDLNVCAEPDNTN
jgi:hypothetical protein